MTDFIRDNTSLGPAKSDYKTTSVPADQKVVGVDWNLLRSALLDIQTYLRANVLDVSSLTSVTSMHVVNNLTAGAGPETEYQGFRAKWFEGVDVANSPTSRDYVERGVRIDYSISDGATTSGSPTLVSAADGNFTTSLIGASVTGTGIPLGTTVIGVPGLTSVTMSANATATGSGLRVTLVTNASQDLLYWKHRGNLSPTLGIGVTPPDGSARVQVSPQDNEPAMGTMRLRVGPSQTGKALVIHDSTPTDRITVDKDFFLLGNNPTTTGGIAIVADSTNQHALLLTDSTKTNFYAFDTPTGSGGVLRVRCQSGGASSFEIGTDGSFRHLSTKLGLFGGAVVTKPTVTGSRASGAALVSLLAALVSIGAITDSTTA